MLKKLVKHGNSSALVLDRSIMALLDIDENSVLKLRIEGDTLLIKASETVKSTESLMAEIEALHEGIRNTNPAFDALADGNEKAMRKYCKKAEADPITMEALKEWMPGTENAEKLQKAYADLFKKHEADLALLQGPAYVEEFEALVKEFEGDCSTAAFHERVLVLRAKHSPNLAKMDEEMKQLPIAMGYPAELM